MLYKLIQFQIILRKNRILILTSNLNINKNYSQIYLINSIIKRLNRLIRSVVNYPNKYLTCTEIEIRAAIKEIKKQSQGNSELFRIAR